MFNLRTYLFKRLWEIYPLHLKRFHTCCSHGRIGRRVGTAAFNNHHRRHRHRRCKAGSFFHNNTRRVTDVDLVDDVTSQSNHYDAHSQFERRLLPTSSFHFSYLNNQVNPYPTALVNQSNLNNNNNNNNDQNDYFKYVKSLEKMHGVIATTNPVNLINQRRFYAVLKSSSSYEEFSEFHTTSWNSFNNFTDIENSKSLILDKEQLIENFAKPIDFHDPQAQMNLFVNLEAQGKYNEILANFQFLINEGIVPSVDIYNKTLSSIILRKNTQETLEESLTNLLNIYSSMLNNNIKPDVTTYNIVLSTLLNGSITALSKLKNFNQGSQYFQVANQLFEVCDHQTLVFDKEFYELYLTCYYTFGGIPSNINDLKLFINEKLGSTNIIYYLFFMKLAIKDISGFNEIYNEYKSAALKDQDLLSHQFKIYQLYIENLIHNDRIDEATMTLDQILNQTRDIKFFPEIASSLISTYLQALSYHDLNQTHDTFLMFDSLPWLPDLQMNSLLAIMNNSLQQGNYNLLNKFWNYSIIRNDFNSLISTDEVDSKEFSNLIMNPSFSNSDIIDSIIQTSLTTKKLNAVRMIKETMLKEITLSNDTVLKILNYLIDSKQPETFITNFIINQGYKKQNKNQYLSSIIDFVPSDVQYNLTRSNFFKNCCESYRLISDNFYGIYRNLIITWDCKDIEIVPKLKYYYSLIYNELNDIDNYYVDIPLELQDFKVLLKSKLDDHQCI